jgi:hypothetical protein
MTSLEVLFIEDNLFTGDIDNEFAKDLIYLFVIDISSNFFTSAEYGIPPHIFDLPQLEVLDFSNNTLQGSIPQEIPVNNRLEFLSVHENMMGGEIPSQLANLIVLEHLDLSNNKFHGPLREEIFGMKILSEVFLSENPGLEADPLPETLATMTQLVEISLKNTNRTGPLPELVGFEKLALLDLDNNKFTGTIPPNYGGLSSLIHLHLNRNDLSGSMPEFTGTNSLATVLVDKTGVTGDFTSICNLPAFTVDIFFFPEVEVIAVADCSDADSGITCPCCHCCSKDQPVCSDPVVSSLDWTWENGSVRTVRDFAIDVSVMEPPSVPNP